MEAAAEAKRHADQQSACDELTCVIHDVKSPVFELGDWQYPPDHRLIADNQNERDDQTVPVRKRGVSAS